MRMTAHVLDLNEISDSFLDLTLRDDDKTVVHLCTPEEGLIDRLQSMGPEFTKRLEKGDKESVELSYDLAAQLISCNLDGLTVTGPELAGKYRMRLVTLMRFFLAYMNAINELVTEKN